MRFISSKTKVASLSRQAIPRLELMGATLLAQHVSHVKKVLSEEFAEYSIITTLWVDSYTVLSWIHNSKSWKQLVKNRVEQINGITTSENYCYCPGKQNPADFLPRGLGAKYLAQNRLW